MEIAIIIFFGICVVIFLANLPKLINAWKKDGGKGWAKGEENWERWKQEVEDWKNRNK